MRATNDYLQISVITISRLVDKLIRYMLALKKYLRRRERKDDPMC